jgi:hypothetical protein
MQSVVDMLPILVVLVVLLPWTTLCNLGMLRFRSFCCPGFQDSAIKPK